ncbi:MAG TPA: hypothetical protein VFN58_05675, partial [Candidatus Binatia bacterium]|nr:hypothetical protein [Candidatus Binatia bacterium]
MVLDVRACLKKTNLATFEQSLIKISINFTLQYGVPFGRFGGLADSRRLFSSDDDDALRASGSH